MDKIAQVWDALPQGSHYVLAGLGALSAAKAAIAVFHFVLNTFLLSGINVGISFAPFPTTVQVDTC